jgi:hypothetical protein
MNVFWVVIGLLTVCAVILLTGRGSFLIAGYNTASPEVKSRYDQKKLTRAVGLALLIIDLATVPLVFVRGIAYLIFYIIFLLAVAAALLFYTNKKCYAPGAEVSAGSGTARKSNKAVLIATAVILLAAAVFTAVMILSGSKAPVYSLSPDKSTFKIESMYGLTIDTSDIQSLELKDTLPGNLKRTNGYGGVGTVLKGFFSSDLGDIRVFLDTSKTLFLYITTPTEVIILNAETDDETRQLYAMLSTEKSP